MAPSELVGWSSPEVARRRAEYPGVFLTNAEFAKFHVHTIACVRLTATITTLTYCACTISTRRIISTNSYKSGSRRRKSRGYAAGSFTVFTTLGFFGERSLSICATARRVVGRMCRVWYSPQAKISPKPTKAATIPLRISASVIGMASSISEIMVKPPAPIGFDVDQLENARLSLAAELC